MDRRTFLKWLGGSAAAAFVLDPEKLLWVPGQKSYHFIHKPDIILTDPYYKVIVRMREDQWFTLDYDAHWHLLNPQQVFAQGASQQHVREWSRDGIPRMGDITVIPRDRAQAWFHTGRRRG